ncbi:hypothetical protein HYE67_005138 [Fusarium culmorum]|uniref:Uncharacterized protein n=1 Tax=Fusarium culmorum TaxID=5516 RepID=A0A7S8HVF6_FUSCU|nr:hypothetical protein HYE67_005138 [Fusarium culmorum]
MTTNFDDRASYQATKHIFVEEKAKTRNLAPLKRWINWHLLTGSPVQRIVTQYGDEAVYHSVMQLLADKVYESTSIAGQRFPDLFESSTAQTTARAQLGEQATKSEQAMLNDITLTYHDDSQDAFDSAETTAAVYGTSDSSSNPSAVSYRASTYRETTKILKLTYYQYRRGDSKLLVGLLLSIAHIRHTAVHRLRTNSIGLERFLADTENLATVLGDNIYTEAISRLYLDAQSTLAELTQNKGIIQLQLRKA